MKIVLLVAMLISVSLSFADSEGGDILSLNEASQNSIVGNYQNVPRTNALIGGVILSAVQCDYDCLWSCKRDCSKHGDSESYNMCLDQCQGMCGCR